MGIPHKHAAIIKAWADGAEIQFNADGEGWVDWVNSNSPIWHTDTKYRIKPKPPIKKYLWAYCKRVDGIARVSKFYYEDEGEFLKYGFLNELGRSIFDWIQRIDASEKEFPAV